MHIPTDLILPKSTKILLHDISFIANKIPLTLALQTFYFCFYKTEISTQFVDKKLFAYLKQFIFDLKQKYLHNE